MWQQIKINTSKNVAEELGDKLFDLGSLSVTFEDTQDTPIFEPKLGEVTLWEDTTVIALFDLDFDLAVVIEEIKDYRYLIERVEDKDWEREWMQDFKPIKFGKRLWICPTWLPVPDSSAVNVLLDPGLAFGSGTHPTTALCLEWLDGLSLNDKTIIDFGCGSGILAVAALKLGAHKAIGIDIDFQAIDASTENAKRNDVNSNLELFLANDVPKDLKVDVLVANILAKPLIDLCEYLSSLLKPNGKFAISGILNEQVEEIIERYQDFFIVEGIKKQGDWSLVYGIYKR